MKLTNTSEPAPLAETIMHLQAKLAGIQKQGRLTLELVRAIVELLMPKGDRCGAFLDGLVWIPMSSCGHSPRSPASPRPPSAGSNNVPDPTPPRQHSAQRGVRAKAGYDEPPQARSRLESTPAAALPRQEHTRAVSRAGALPPPAT